MMIYKFIRSPLDLETTALLAMQIGRGHSYDLVLNSCFPKAYLENDLYDKQTPIS
jgi:hypothetical protein